MNSRFQPPHHNESFEQEPTDCEDCGSPFYPDLTPERGAFERKCEMCKAAEEKENEKEKGN